MLALNASQGNERVITMVSSQIKPVKNPRLSHAAIVELVVEFPFFFKLLSNYQVPSYSICNVSCRKQYTLRGPLTQH